MTEENAPSKNGEDTELSIQGDIDAGPQNSETDTESVVSSSAVNNNTKQSEDEKKDKKLIEPGNCYCGKERNLNIVELLCANCSRWFHESCIGYQLGKLVPFLTNYTFICKNCSATGLETFRKSQAQITQMCVTAIANLQQMSTRDGTNKLLFNKDKDIIPYIEHHWEALTTTSRRVTQSWHLTVNKTLVKDIHVLFVFEESPEGQMYGLVNTDLTSIKPNYDAMIKATGIKSRNTKRKFPGDVGGPGKKSRGVDVAAPKLPAHGYPLDHPFNKDGYRYLLAEPDPHAPFRQEFDESADLAGKPIPGWLYRTSVPGTVLLALQDRAPQLKISEDRLAVTGEKGYSTVRATHCVTKGCWYWEATIEEMPEGSATRLGWGQDYANLQAPLGYDKFGYSWRSKKGTIFHQSRGKHYSKGYGEGDTVGFLIVLPQVNTTKLVPSTYKDRPLVKFKSHLYYEEKDNVQERLKSLIELSQSKIVNYKNGECQGVAFENIFQGSYYPTLSLHKNITVSVNFGPNFKYPPSTNEYKWRPMSEKAEEAICEQTMADVIYLTENDGRLRLDSFVL
ncbi:set1/Ash2 histone methyltransferase complex subunit ash2 [Rhynchophorus ferrugineus]|uniref:set1/Ash2 histone methyltransferase complex subunit ash2 n=1 Tax=Rhynchophorus ferrugineus TaxID=354439 RepID=UPI003FCD11A3